MARPPSLAFFIPLLVATGCIQPESVNLTQAQKQALEATRQELAAAILERDIEGVDRVYSDDYLLTNRNGLVRTKQDRIQMLASGQLRYLSLGDETEVTTVFHSNVAIVRALRSSAEYLRDGERGETGPKRVMEIWVYDGNRWQQVARQHTSTVSDAAQPAQTD